MSYRPLSWLQLAAFRHAGVFVKCETVIMDGDGWLHGLGLFQTTTIQEKTEKGCGDVVREVLAIRQFGFKF